jgi:hypothetical protein
VRSSRSNQCLYHPCETCECAREGQSGRQIASKCAVGFEAICTAFQSIENVPHNRKELPNSLRNLGDRQLGFSLVCEGGRTKEHSAVL